MKSFGPKAWVLPQPVLIIGTYDKDGKANAMNAAWGGQWDNNEIMISMGSHATTENLNERGEFTVAFAAKDTLVAADYVGIVSAKNEPSKMAKTGWTVIPSENVAAPVFAEFPMTLECRIKEKIDESESGYNIIAEIVNILVDEKYLAEDGKPDVEKMGLITFDPCHFGYIALGQKAGNAFSDGKKLSCLDTVDSVAPTKPVCEHNPSICCPCPKECPRHGKCCLCVAHHKEHGKLPACLREQQDK